MLLDAFGADALPVLVAGGSGGLVRGLYVLRTKSTAGPLTSAVLVVVGIDIITSVIIGALAALFGAGWVLGALGPVLGNADAAYKGLSASFAAGMVAITVLGLVIDGVDIRARLKKQDEAKP